MSWSAQLIAGKNECAEIDWYEKVLSHSLAGTVDRISKNGRQIYYINLQNIPTNSLFGIATLINQLYLKNFCNFEIANCNCEEKVWNYLFKQVYTIVDKSKERVALNLDIILNADNERTLRGLEPSVCGFLADRVKLQFVMPPVPKEKPKSKSSSSGSQTPPKAPKLATRAHKALNLENLNGGQMIMSFGDDGESDLSFTLESSLPPRAPSPEYMNPDLPLFGEYRLRSSGLGGSVDLCEITPSVTLIRNQRIFESFCLEMHVHEITRVHVKMSTSNNNDEVMVDVSEAALFMLELMQKEIFSHITFEGFSNGFELIAEGSYEKLTSLDFKGDRELDGWIKKLASLVKNSPRLTSLSCDAATEIKSKKLLNTVLTLSPTLKSLNLRGTQVDAEILAEWLTEERDFTGIERKAPLALVLPKPKLAQDQLSLVNEAVKAFNEASKNVVQLTFIETT